MLYSMVGAELMQILVDGVQEHRRQLFELKSGYDRCPPPAAELREGGEWIIELDNCTRAGDGIVVLNRLEALERFAERPRRASDCNACLARRLACVREGCDYHSAGGVYSERFFHLSKPLPPRVPFSRY